MSSNNLNDVAFEQTRQVEGARAGVDCSGALTMKTQAAKPVQQSAVRALSVLLGTLALGPLGAVAQSNIWTSPVSGKWETSSNWSLGAPIVSDSLFITNSGSKTVTIDATTAGSFTNTLTVTNVTLGASGTNVNTLFLNNAGTSNALHVLFSLGLASNGVLAVNHSLVKVDQFGGNGGLSVGTVANGSGNLVVVTNGGQLITQAGGIGGVSGFNDMVMISDTNSTWFNTNGSLAILDSAPSLALLVTNGGGFVGNSIYLGDSASADGNLILVTGPGSTWINFGTLNIGGPSLDNQFVVSNGAAAFSSNAIVGNAFGRGHSAMITGSNSVWRSDGTIQVGAGGSNNIVIVSNNASLLVSNGTHTAEIDVNNAALNVSGATFNADILALSNNATMNSSDDLRIGAGGSVTITNSTLQEGGFIKVGTVSSGISTFTLLSGSVQSGNSVLVGDAAYSFGTLNLNGGTLTIPGADMEIAAANATGIVNIAGGTLSMTGSGVVLGSYGTGILTVSNGNAIVPSVQIGNASGTMGTLDVRGGEFDVNQWVWIGNNVGSRPCYVTVWTNGTLVVTNASHTAYIDSVNGGLTINGGTVLTDNLILTNGGTFTNNGGTFVLVPTFKVDNGSSASLLGGTNVFGGGLSVGGTTGSTGTVNSANTTVTISSDFTAGAGTNSSATINLGTNSNVSVAGTLFVGSVGSAQFNMAGGSSMTAPTIRLGGTGGVGSGDLITQTGSHLTFHFLSANYYGPGGDADGTGGTIIIGDDHAASMFVSGGSTTNVGFLSVGNRFGGTFLQNGGTVMVRTNMSIGSCDVGAVGSSVVSGGIVYVTNQSHTATLVISNGAFVLNPGGRLVVDTLVLTNPCGHFTNNGGSGALQVLVRTNLDLNLSAVGDGIPNWWKMQYGFDPFDPTVASADPDHDGMSNLAEYLAGTDPTNPNSNFRVTSVVVTNGTNIRVDWTTVGGHSYVIQAITNNSSLSKTNFYDLPGATVSSTTPGEGVTNYVHRGGATNSGGYYRVRLGP